MSIEQPRTLPSSATLRWLENETFYSICSRQHRFLGHLNSATTSAWLFGSTAARTTHDFPYNLEALSAEVKSTWGNPIEIILRHTILPFFFPFQSKAKAEEALEALKSSRLGSLKYRLGLLTSRFGAEHPLKACPTCMISDRSAHGVAYWHLSHQYPGVLVCPEHHLPLIEAKKNRQWSGEFQWCLPDDNVLSPIAPTQPEANVQLLLEQLAKAVIELATYGFQKIFTPDIVREVYRSALANLGFSRPMLERAAVSFAYHASQLQPYPPLLALPTTTAGAAALLEQLTRSPRCHSHPLKHLVLITWLFGSLRPFIDAYDQLETLHSEKSKAAPLIDFETRNVARQVEIASDGRIIKRRPKTIKEPIRLEILDRLAIGEDKKSICSSFDITISTVNKLLRSEQGAKKQWEIQTQNKKQTQQRNIWLSKVLDFPKSGAKRIRSVIPQVYAWLYRNDRVWLENQIRTLPIERHGNHSNVDWALRDKELLADIQSAMLTHFPGQLTVKKEVLNLLCPSLAKALERKDHYPYTRMLVRQLTAKGH